MNASKRVKFIRLGIASLLVSTACLILTNNYNPVGADANYVSLEGLKSLSLFSMLAYLFLACSVVFFLIAVFRKD